MDQRKRDGRVRCEIMKIIVGWTKDLQICYMNNEKPAKVLGNREV